MADNLPPPSADVTESGSLNLPEPSGPHRPVMGMLYLYSFLLDAESTPGPQCGRKDYVNEKFQRHYRESTPQSSG
jgi:hypothetical protein